MRFFGSSDGQIVTDGGKVTNGAKIVKKRTTIWEKSSPVQFQRAFSICLTVAAT
jgi:hypothetical protein